jgi:hypothetical protein
MATQKFIDTLKWWLKTGRITTAYIQTLVPLKLTQVECDDIINGGV